jgi:hypothetical protein
MYTQISKINTKILSTITTIMLVLAVTGTITIPAFAAPSVTSADANTNLTPSQLVKFCSTISSSANKKCIDLGSTATPVTICNAFYSTTSTSRIKKAIFAKELTKCVSRVSVYVMSLNKNESLVASKQPVSSGEKPSTNASDLTGTTKADNNTQPILTKPNTPPTSRMDVDALKFCKKYSAMVDLNRCKTISLDNPVLLCSTFAEVRVELSNAKFNNAVKANNACQSLLAKLIPNEAPAIVEKLKKDITNKSAIKSLRNLCVSYYKLGADTTACINSASESPKGICDVYFAISTSTAKNDKSSKYNKACMEQVQKIIQ